MIAAQQDAARLAAREAEVADDAAVLEDVELLTRLAELRSAIAGNVTAHPGLRASLLGLSSVASVAATAMQYPPRLPAGRAAHRGAVPLGGALRRAM